MRPPKTIGITMLNHSYCEITPDVFALAKSSTYRSAQLMHLLASQRPAAGKSDRSSGARFIGEGAADSTPSDRAENRGTDLATPEAIQRILDNGDPVLRNLQITQAYHELTLALEEVLGGKNRAWCVFATWASKQAGQFIRGDVIPAPLRSFLGLDSRRRWRGAWRPSWWLKSGPVLSYLRFSAQDVSRHVAEGNRLVFAKMAPLFAQFVEFFSPVDASDNSIERTPEEVESFLSGLLEGSATDEILQQAFRSFATAISEPDEKLRAERILLANLLVGLHEQMRLQVAISGGLRSPLQRALDGPRELLPHWPVPKLVRRFLAASLRRLFAGTIRRFDEEFRQVATQCLMTLGLPEGNLHLGDDLPRLKNGAAFPADLEDITLLQLETTLARFDRTPHSLAGSGARDWASLGDRMNFVADYFRSRQQEESHLQPPFSLEQVDGIKRGNVPKGRL